MTTVIFRSSDRARCQELWAVLDAARIPAEIAERGWTCLLLVRDEDLPRAVQELDDYRREVSERRSPPPAFVLPGGAAGMVAYWAVLVAVAGLAARNAWGANWLDAGRAQAGAIRDGEWWRALTALTLHLDARHLFGNLAFGSIFGWLAAQRLGGGLAWLAILAGGGVGNAANAWLQQPSHSAVGASTAVFAGLGLTVALALDQRSANESGRLRRFGPLIAGVLLLAWTGMGGERTDVLAHVTGAVAGLGVGALAGRVPAVLLERRAVQTAAAGLAASSLVLAWVLALGS